MRTRKSFYEMNADERTTYYHFHDHWIGEERALRKEVFDTIVELTGDDPTDDALAVLTLSEVLDFVLDWDADAAADRAQVLALAA